MDGWLGMGWRDGVEVFIYIYILPPAGGRFAPKVIKCAYGAVEGRRERAVMKLMK